MKKVIALFALVMMVGFLNAQEISASVTQKVDATIAQYEGKVDVSDQQKQEIRNIMIKYESLIENERKSMKRDRSNMDAVEAKVKEYKGTMMNEINEKLTPDQRATVKAIREGKK